MLEYGVLLIIHVNSRDTAPTVQTGLRMHCSYMPCWFSFVSALNSGPAEPRYALPM